MFENLRADFAACAANRFEPLNGQSRLRQAWICWRTLWQAEAMFAVVRYRAAVWMRRHHIPVLPWLLDRWNQKAGLSIGKPVRLGPGVYFPHSYVVLDGIVTIGRSCVFSPWATVGLVAGVLQGPAIGDRVQVGTGAKILGPVTIGDDARIGANAVVITDIPPGATAVGVPARVVRVPAPQEMD